VTDAILLFPLGNGTYAVIKNDPIRKGDRVLTFPLDGGGRVSIKSVEAQPGERVVQVPRKTGTVPLRCMAVVDGVPKGARVLRREQAE
jgi:hypothetical protein